MIKIYSSVSFNKTEEYIWSEFFSFQQLSQVQTPV